MEQLGADCGRVHVIDESESALSLADERIEQAIVKMGAKLFILDPLQAYLGGADMHSAGGIRPLMKSIGAIAERTGCAIVAIGHLNKKGGKAQYRGLGSIDIFAAARSVLTVGKIDVDENMRALVHNKSNLAPPGAPLAYGLDANSGFTWLGDYDITIDELLAGKKQRPENQFAKARRLIENALRDGPVAAVDMEQMAEEQGISMKTFHRAKSALGVVSIKCGGGWYWELSIEVAFTECGADSQDGQTPGVSTLTVAPLYDETAGQDIHSDALNILSNGCGDVASEDGQTSMSNALTIFPAAEAG